MQKPKTHVVIVPASFAPSSLYSDFVQCLSECGLSATTVDLPSVGNRDPLPAASMMEDAEQIKMVTTKLADNGHEIILLMHSYGGVCGTESTAGVSKAERQALKKPGGIVHLVYISSPVPEIGGSVATMMGDNMPHFMKLQGDYLISEPDGCASVNFSDLPYAQSIQYATQMTAHSAKSFAGPLQNAGYVNIPVSYIVCENDVSVPPALQRSVIDMISTKSGREVTTLLCNSGHFPSVSAPAELASLIDRVATSC
ncbi:hypothetical protein PITC_060740 [Penicillium italicum]|uniref:AB hydrolase-1 domain-containing protein n=1 Tax=Penicillium italicum TaxID=40296 RepID=A0A0A2LFA3_PENIT|nr:hypothetical protein PITC_060740 [Penicillium italicum]